MLNLGRDEGRKKGKIGRYEAINLCRDQLELGSNAMVRVVVAETNRGKRGDP